MKGLPEDFGTKLSEQAGFTAVERAVLLANMVYKYVERYEQHEPLAEGIPFGSYDAETFYSLVRVSVLQFLPPEMFWRLQQEGQLERLQERGKALYWQMLANDGSEEG